MNQSVGGARNFLRHQHSVAINKQTLNKRRIDSMAYYRRRRRSKKVDPKGDLDHSRLKRNILNSTDHANRTYVLEGVTPPSTEKLNEEIQVHIDAFTGLFTRVDSIISGKQIECKVSTNSPLAWTDGRDVYFGSDNLIKVFRDYLNTRKQNSGKDYLKALGHLRGLNYHEVAHCKFTPKRSSGFIRGVIALDKNAPYGSDNYYKAFNALEDMRIETLFSTLYPNSRHFFTDAVFNYILDAPSAGVISPWSYLLVYGRKFLPLNIRSGMRDIFLNDLQSPKTEKQVARFEQIIDAYRALTLSPKECNHAISLVTEFADLMQKLGGQNMLPEPTGGAGHENQTYNQQEKAQAGELQKRIEEEDSEEEDSEEEDSDGDSEAEELRHGDSDADGDKLKDSDGLSLGLSDADGDSDGLSDGDRLGDSLGDSLAIW